MIDFIRRHPKLLLWSISLLTLVTGYLLAGVNWTMLQLIVLKGKDPNPPPPPPPCPTPPPPRQPEEPKRKMLQYHYVPSWVAASFKNVRKHPLYGGITVPDYDSVVAPYAPLPPSVTAALTELQNMIEVTDSTVVADDYQSLELSPTITAVDESPSTEQLGSETNAD